MNASGLHVETIGIGTPVLALHGAYSAGPEVQGFLEPFFADRPGYRRLYPDLPGMGDSTGVAAASAPDVVDVLDAVVDARIGDVPFLLLGYSWGAHLARGLAARRPDQVAGLALLCPMVPDDMHAEPAVVVEDDGAAATLPEELRGEYTGYFVVRTARTAARFTAAVAPVLGRYDGAVVAAQMERWPLDLGSRAYAGPVLVMTGRHDAVVGYRQQAGLVEAYPGATAVLAADAGHALPHERPVLLAAALDDWRSRAATVA